jgi:hypothetical protein
VKDAILADSYRQVAILEQWPNSFQRIYAELIQSRVFGRVETDGFNKFDQRDQGGMHKVHGLIMLKISGHGALSRKEMCIFFFEFSA